ncbi:MAG: lamin tail domain-containing protein [Verrucomicrobia bacterium]|nr:lamin tail domain-containing protein [Verrucomicrobiota bacterium]
MNFSFLRVTAGGVMLMALFGSLNSAASVVISEIMYHPASEDVREEFIELHNAGTTNVSLLGWRFSKGVQFTFPSVSLAAGDYLVVAADVTTFTNKYHGVTNVVGTWTGRLSNSREDIALDDAAGNRVDSVKYADEGDWAVRRRGPMDRNHRGWIWFAEHDGGGKSLELINPKFSNNHGVNWASSLTTDGTPGAPNSVAQTNIAPVIREVQHLPPVPRSTDNVLVTARLLDERGSNVTASLHWRVDGAGPAFTSVPMPDDGLHDDGAANDGIVAATIPAQANNAVVEFYIEATDFDGLTRTWPAAAQDANGDSLGQVCNALYQVDDAPYPGVSPLYKMVMTEAERAELAQIGSGGYPGESLSDAQMNGTFISLDATGTEVRYTVGFRNRGHGSRNRKPNNQRVNFVSDRTWKGVSGLNLNAQYTHVQILGSVLSLKSGVIGADSRPVQVRVNNANLANNGPQTYGGMYAANEAIGSDWADHWFPDDSSGNVYRVIRDIAPPDFNYRGTDQNAYTNTWFKESNVSEDNWSDLIGMLRIMGTNDLFTTESARGVINAEQWLTYLAVMALFENRETSPNTGHNDDYFVYAGVNDPRFILMYYDLDTILGEGSAAGATNATIFGATAMPGFNRFMRSPDFEPVYYRTLQRLLDTTFSAAEFNTTVDQTLGEFAPASVTSRIKTWMNGRRAYVQSVIAPFLTTNAVAPVASITGEPRSPTPLRTATLTVGGAGVTQYRYKLNDGDFNAATPVATPITLSDLPQGSTNVAWVIGAGADNVWQSEASATTSMQWVINTYWPAVRINEVLARNVASFNHAGTFPDAIELYNEGSTVVDLSGLRLSDRVNLPNKFTFPNGTTLAAGAHLVVLANNADGTPGLHTGFSLNQDGEGVFLFDTVSSGGALLDSAEFGLQLADLSIGRLNGGEFMLTQPTLGAANLAQPLGGVMSLSINEWLASEFALFPTDFIEIYNPNPLPVAMGGLYFTDNPLGQPKRHAVAPLTFIGAQGYCVFKPDSDPEQGADHLNFGLAAEQGMIALLTPELETIDCIAYGPQRTDVSQGRSPDGSGTIASFLQPSPGAPNPGASSSVQTVTLVTLTNVWRFNQTDDLTSVNWTTAAYSDDSWPAGAALLYHDDDPLPGPKNTELTIGRMTYYFRTHFNFSGDPATAVLRLSPFVDDGAIFYLNGQPLYNLAVTGTLLTYSTPASRNVNNAVLEGPFTVPATNLVPGDNVLAVEVHQVNTTSGDIVFGAQLDAAITTPAGPAIVLNEILANNQSITNAAGRTPDWVELYNPRTNSIDLGDLSLSDDPGVPRKWVFANGTTLAPDGYLVIQFDDGLPATADNTGFALSASGDGVYLFQRPALGGAVLSSVTFGLQASDFSIGRVPNGSGDWIITLPTRNSQNVAAGLGNASFLVINEWMANPTTGADWFELYNPNAQPVDLSGLALTDNPSVRNKSPFPPRSFIGPRSHVQLIADDNQASGADHVAFQLSADGEFIGLYWPAGTQIHTVSFGPQTSGISEGRFPDGAAAIVSFPDTASPGSPNYQLLTNVVINELLSHTDPPLEDAVEIHNLSSNAVDLSGWYLSNTGENPAKFLVPANTVLAAGGFQVFYQYQFDNAVAPGVLSPFSFNSAHGDEFHLSQTDTNGSLTGFRARAKFGAATNGISFGRFVTSVGEEFVAMSSRSFGVDNPANVAQFRTGTGSANPYPRVGPVVVSEINYRPATNYLGNTNAAEFLELLNITSDPVTLYDPAATTNTWRISGGVEFTFPMNVTLPAGGSALIVSFDPIADPAQSNWFRTAYQVLPNVRMFGPWTGALANEGERLELLRPDPPQRPPQPDAGFVPYVLVEHVHYLPAAPWPTNGVGAGSSLQRAVPAGFGNEPLFWFAAPPSAGASLNDTDGDGLPDYWEIMHGLSPTNSVGLDGANGDPDNDGQSNRQEFLAGSNPQIGSDYFHIESVSLDANIVTLRFQAAGGRTYSVLYRDDSPVGPWLKLADVPLSANSRQIEITDAGFVTANRRFYRLTAPAQLNP